MSQSTSNVRVRRTQKLLREALIELIEERGFEALTVGEITERAMVSRAAFYRNYQDKYDLVEQIFAEATSGVLNATDDLRLEHPSEGWVTLFEHIGEYEQLYRALLGSRGSPQFVRKMRAALVGLITERGHPPSLSVESGQAVHTSSDQFVAEIVSAMFVEAITWWLEHKQLYSPKEMATRTALLASVLFKEAHAWR